MDHNRLRIPMDKELSDELFGMFRGPGGEEGR